MGFRKTGITAFVMLLLAGVAAGVGAQGFEKTSLSSHPAPCGEPPFVFEGSRYAVATFLTSPEVLRELVPEPLQPNPKGLMTIVVVLHKVVSPVAGEYREAFLSVPVSLGEQKGSYFPVLYLDETVPIVCGREIYGMSKIDAEIEWTETPESIRATVKRLGTTLVDMTLQLAPPLATIPPMPNEPIFSLKWIPSVRADAPPDVEQLTSTTTQNDVVLDLRPGQAEVAFGSLPTDPLSSIPILQVVQAASFEEDFVLGHGQVVHDYLGSDTTP